MAPSDSSRPEGLLTLPAQPGAPRDPTALSCLRCQLLGRRRLLCTRVDACRTVPHVYAVGPILLAGWLVTLAAFLFAVWG
ncbi:hypothetical protein AMPC_31650 [Anaeromyxobacter paludicola]|uniref:Uncharacterized protein n=1 Tax=Anaeromyxobacter paludicola TaxID=2918171 RepID=A0ABN6N9Z0_9BACT|nr:hypothetical protein AMPC_31650 [Anaeromyxobacter paludicola]